MSSNRTFRTCLNVIALSCTVLGRPAQAGESTDARNLYRRTVTGVALIVVDDGHGTGWIIDRKRRLLVTNHHVVNGDDRPYVYFPVMENGRLIAEPEYYKKRGAFENGRVLFSDKQRDLAIIQVPQLPAQCTVLTLAETAEPGQRVHSIGNPGSSYALWVYSNGTVRQTYRTPADRDCARGGIRIVETQVPINAGDSGGPVVDDDGKVVGVSAAVRIDASLVTISIDVSEVRKAYSEVLNVIAVVEYFQKLGSSFRLGRLLARR
jgi:S1-C subfamily serine protease